MSEALDIYLKELKITKFFCKCFGFDVFRETFNFTFMTIYSMIYVSIYHIGQLYSIYYFRNDFVNLIFSLVCWAYGSQVLIGYQSLTKILLFKIFQGISFMHSFYSHQKEFWKMHLSFVDIYKKFSNNDVILENTRKIQLMTQIISISMSTNIICSIIYPYINAIFIEKKKVLSFGFLLPFSDPKTDFGFYINYIFQQNCWVFGGMANMGVFRVFWMLIGQIVIKAELLKCMIQSLRELVDANLDGKNNKKISLQLSEIIDFHISYLQYIEGFETVANSFFFVFASTTTFQVSIILLVLTYEVISFSILKWKNIIKINFLSRIGILDILLY